VSSNHWQDHFVRTLVAFGAALVVVLAGCGSSNRSGQAATTTTTSTSVPALVTIKTMTALGDSVPFGTACNCTPYPTLSAADLAHAAGHDVTMANDAKPGYTSADVVAQVQQDPAVRVHVTSSQAVLIEVGANDVAHSSTCGTTVSCYETKLPQIKSNLEILVQRARELTAGHHVGVVLLDYWSVWLGGQYAQAQGQAYVDAAETVTAGVNDTIEAVAHTMHAVYVDLRTAFRGPDDTWDETHLLASDGDHPNAAGHERIAEAIAAVVAP
jgi:lysophospholipase L1-like esterase